MLTVMYMMWSGFSSVATVTSAAGGRFSNPQLQGPRFATVAMTGPVFSQPTMT